MNYPSVTTDRFILKVMTADLVGPNYVSWFSDQQAAIYITYAKHKVTLEGLRDYVSEKLESPKALMFGIFVKSDSSHIGNIKFEPIDFSAGTAVLGVLIGSPEWRSRGVFSEISAGLEASLKIHGIRCIYLGVDTDNELAVSAYKKAGYIIDSSNHLSLDLKKTVCMVKSIG